MLGVCANVDQSGASLSGSDPYAESLKFIAFWQGFVGRNSDVFSLVGAASDINLAKKNKLCAVIIGEQNSHHFRNTKDVKLFYDLGQRVSQLTYNNQNLIGSGCLEREDGGLSDFGVSIIKAMNETGMLVDTSHCGDKTTLDAIDSSAVPIAITHSNCRALINSPRAKTDEAIIYLSRKGGVMGITGVRNFVSATDPTTIVNVVDHIDHVKNLVGLDHVGIGTDADIWGYDSLPHAKVAAMESTYKSGYAFRDKIDIDDFRGPLKMYNLVEELVRRKYSDSNIRAVLGENFFRLLKSTWK